MGKSSSHSPSRSLSSFGEKIAWEEATINRRSRARTQPIKMRPVPTGHKVWLLWFLVHRVGKSRKIHYAWHSRHDLAQDDSSVLSKDQRGNSVGLLFILCGVFGKISFRFRFMHGACLSSNWSDQCLLFTFSQDLFAVSCFLPLLTHRARELGASPSIVGVIGTLIYWSIKKNEWTYQPSRDSLPQHACTKAYYVEITPVQFWVVLYYNSVHLSLA